MSLEMDPRFRPVRILTLDGDGGGGVKPISQIRIVRHLMSEIWKLIHEDENVSDEDVDQMRPHEYFDLIMGAGTGGLIALYLGRFRLTIKECEDAYLELASAVYGNPLGWFDFVYSPHMQYDHNIMESIIKQQIKRYKLVETKNAVCNMCDCDGENVVLCNLPLNSTQCRSGVLALPAAHTQYPRILRSFVSRTSTDHKCFVWQAMRATTASWKKFPSVKAAGEVFVAPEMGHNNPAKSALKELTGAFGHEDIRCLISIGSGKPPANQLAPHGFLPLMKNIVQFLQGGVPDALKPMNNMALDCEHVHQDLLKKGDLKEKYFRFNIEEKEEFFRLDTWNDHNQKAAEEAIDGYLQDPGNLNPLTDSAKLLRL